jgi:hypothetical protein
MEKQLPHTNQSHYRIISKIGAGGLGEVYQEDSNVRHER